MPGVQEKGQSELAGRVAGESLFDGYEVLQRLGHLAPFNGEVARMQEVAYPVVVAKPSLGVGGVCKSICSTFKLRHSVSHFLSQILSCYPELNTRFNSPALEITRITIHDVNSRTSACAISLSW